jgi:flagellar biogenesis protein FliO
LRRDAEAVAEGGLWTPSVLLLGLGVAAGGYAAWRRRARRQPHPGGRWGDPAVTRLSSQALTPHASVHAVQWNGEEFLLACTPQQVTVLAHRPVAADPGGTP